MDDQDESQDEQYQQDDVNNEEQPEQSEQPEEVQQTEETPQSGTPPPEPTQLTGQQALSSAQQQQLDDLSDEELNSIVSQLTPGEDGTVDLKEVVKVLHQRNRVASKQYAREEAFQAFNEIRAEERAWEDAYKDYSDLRTDTESRDLVQAVRDSAILRGEYLSPKQAADRLFNKFKAAKEEGVRQTQESVRVQQAAHLETSAIQGDPGADNTRDLYSRIDKPGAEGSDARQALIKQWMKDGKIKTAGS